MTTASAIAAGERLILAALTDGSIASRAELSAATGLPKTTVTGIVARLMQRGVLVEYPAQPGGHRGRGRPAGGLGLARPDGVVVVLALSHAAIRAAIMGWDGTVAAIRHEVIESERDESRIIGHGVALVEQTLAEAGLGLEQTACAVVGIPGAYQRGVGIVFGRVPEPVRTASPEVAKVYGWLRTDPAPAIQQRLGVPVVAENYANLAALGEATFGAARGLTDAVFVRVVEGLGAGLILGGRLHRGARGLAGELAHVQVLEDGAWCACGSRGCLAITNSGELRTFVRSAYPMPLTVDDLNALLAVGDGGTRRVFADAGRRVGRVLADMCVMLSPEAIVIDGMLGLAAEPFLAGVREMVVRHTPTALADAVQLRVGELADRAELLGAVALARVEDLSSTTARYA